MSVEARVAELWQSEMVPEDEVERFEENKMEENRSYETTFHMQSEVDKLFLSVDVNILFFYFSGGIVSLSSPMGDDNR